MLLMLSCKFNAEEVAQLRFLVIREITGIQELIRFAQDELGRGGDPKTRVCLEGYISIQEARLKVLERGRSELGKTWVLSKGSEEYGRGKTKRDSS